MADEGLITGPPDFVGVGTQRSGTTWWQRLITNHPKIRGAADRKKEQHFFDWFGKTEMTDADIARYHERFPRQPGELVGEWTPRYMRDLWTPRLLARVAPHAKLLIMLRDPVDRYRSGVVHRLARTPERRATWLASDGIERSRYAIELRRVLDYFDESQVLVLQYERCVAKPLEQYRRTLEFLGLPPDHVPARLTRTRGTPTRQRQESLWPDFKLALTRALEPDVAEIIRLVPDIQLDLWPNFAHLAQRAPAERVPEPAPAPRRRPRRGDGGPPDFVGVGTSYSGAAWWHEMMLEHPSIEPPRGSLNLRFFGTFCARAMTDEDVDAYHAFFPPRPGKVIGEWTRRYIFDIWTPMLLHRAAPDAKLLVMLVDPAERYMSKLGDELSKPHKDERLFMSDTVGRGRYASQLRGLLEYYERDQILALQYEQCVRDPLGQYARTLRFLGVADDFVPAELRTGPIRRVRRMLGRAKRRLPGAPPPEANARVPLWPDLEIPLRAELEPEVAELRALVPDLDLSLWPTFAHLADRDAPAAVAVVAAGR